MPVYDDQKTVPDDDELARITGINPHEAERNARADTAEDTTSEPDSFSPEDITDRESSSNRGGYYRADRNEVNSLAGLTAKPNNNEKQVGNGFTPTSTPDQPGEKFGSRFNKAKQALQIVARSRGARIGGGTAGIIAIMMTFLGISGFQLEMQNFRDNAIFRANKAVNQALADRRLPNLYKSIKKLNQGKLKGVKAEQFADMLREKDFEVELKNDKITKISFTAENGKGQKITKSVDLNGSNAKRNFLKMFDNSEVGRKAALAMDEALGGKGTTFKSPRAGDLYRKLGVRFTDWLDRKPSEKAGEDKQAKYVDNLRHAQMEGTDEARVNVFKTQEELDEESKKNNTPQQTLSDNTDLLNEAKEYGDRLLDDPFDTGEMKTDGADTNTILKAVNDAGGDIQKAVESDTTGILRKTLGKAILHSLSTLGAIQTSCTIDGTLKFFNNMANVLLAYDVIKYSFLMMNATDNQRAGVQTAAATAMWAHALNRADPDTGKSASHSNARRSIFNGEPGVPQSPFSLATLSISRRPQGLLGQASTLAHTIVSAMGGQTTCKVVNNGVVQAGGLVVGLGATIFTGGGSIAGQATLNLTLAVAEQLALSIAERMIIQSLVHAVINGWEYGDFQMDTWVVGWENARNLVANSLGLVAATEDTVTSLNTRADTTERIAQSQKSIYERYLSTTDGRSALATTVTAIMPYYSNPGLIGSTLFRNISSMPTNALNLFTGKASAVTIPKPICDDPSHPIVRKYNIHVNQYCVVENAYSPNLDDGEDDETETILRNANQIDDEGKVVPESEFEDYINLCLKGNLPQYYNAEISKEGTNDIGQRFAYQIGGGHEADPCVGPVKGKPLPGDSVGRFERYRQWNSYIRVDEPATIQEATDTFGPDDISSADLYFASTTDTYAHNGLNEAPPQNSSIFSELTGSIKTLRTTFKKLTNPQQNSLTDPMQLFNGLWHWSLQ